MCLWLLTACLGIAAPAQQFASIPIVTSGGPPPPIVLPTTGPAPATTLAPTVPPLTFPTTVTLPTFPTLPPTTTPPPTTKPPTLAPLTPVPTPPPATTAAPATVPTTTQPIPNIDPRIGGTGTAPLKLRDTEPLVKFGGGDYVDIVIEANGGPDSMTFPRNRRGLYDIFRNKRQTVNCGCLLPAQCPATGNTDGTGLIDFRIGALTTCATGLRYCCGSTSSVQVSCGSRLQTAVVYPTQAGQARYGDYPWMVVIMTNDNQYVGGGTLIDMQNVITTAHRIAPYPNGLGLKIRVGEWDAAGNYEQYPYRDFSIAKVWTHEGFNPNTLQNDLALIRLTGGVPAGTPGVVPVCLPTAGQVFDGQRCWVSGWGKDSFGATGRYQTVLKAVDVPVIPAASCETTLRTTRLGTAYMLDRTAFLCAGGEVGKDACTGDGGSGLVCETTTGRWTVAGLVAWGLGCATQGVPAAYVNIVNYLPWIQARQSMAA